MANSASTANGIAEAHQRLLANRDIQFDLPPPPQVQAPPVRGSSPWLDWIGTIGSSAGWLMWVAIGLFAALILFVIVRSLIRNRSQREAPAIVKHDLAEWRPEEKQARALLADADALAAEGRYEEAARLLLHRSLDDIRKRKPKLLKPALTSREIGLIDGLPSPVRSTFQVMAGAVERSLFAGRQLSREAWEEARAAYDAFALKGSWA
ncbi:MAG: hypothetical protein ABW182_07420 [Sphingomonas sp.]